jgi:putative transposase
MLSEISDMPKMSYGNRPLEPKASKVEFLKSERGFAIGFTDSQIMDALKRSEAGIPVTDICRELGVSTPAFYRWKSKYGGMDVSLMSKMKELEEKNRQLRKMYLDEKLKAEIVTEALEKKW